MKKETLAQILTYAGTLPFLSAAIHLQRKPV